MKIALYSSTDYDLFDKFIETAKKYAKDNKIILTTHQQFEDYYYANFEVDSLDFLPQLEQDLLKIKSSIMGLIFSTIEDGSYEINIYDGYLD